MQPVIINSLSPYEVLLHQYLDGKVIPPSTKRSSTAKRNQAFFCHPLWDTAPREAFEHELFAVAYARYFRQDAVSNTTLLRRVAALAPESLMRAVRYAQLFLTLDSPRWHEVAQLAFEGAEELNNFIKLQEIINREYLRLKHEVQQAQYVVNDLSALEFLLYASLYGFMFLLPERVKIDWLLGTIGGYVAPAPELLAQARAASAAYDQRYTLAVSAIRNILAWKLRTRPEEELQLDEQAIEGRVFKHLGAFLSPGGGIPQEYAAHLSTVSQLIHAHMDLQEFLERSADSYSFNPDFNLTLSPCHRYVELDPTTPQRSRWDNDGEKLEYLETYWFTRAVQEGLVLGLAEESGRLEKHLERKQFALLKTLQSRMYLAEVYGVPDEVVLEGETRVDIFAALLSGHLTAAFFQAECIDPFGEYLHRSKSWHVAMGRLALEGLLCQQNRLPLTWATRATKAQALVSWTASARFPEGDLATATSMVEFCTLDLKAWATRLRGDSRADFPELYERPYLQFGECLVQIPWLGAFRNTTNATINRLRQINSGLREQTQAIEERLGRLLQERDFQVVMNYHPPRRDDEEDAGEVDVICQRDGHVFVLEVKSSYVRRDFREAWLHKYQTLRSAGRQVARKCAAVCHALRSDSNLVRGLGLDMQGEVPTLHSWIVDTCIEHDHERFSGHLKVSLEELLIVLRDERHLLLGLPEPTRETNLYPDGFSAGRFAAIVEGNELWSMLEPAPWGNF